MRSGSRSGLPAWHGSRRASTGGLGSQRGRGRVLVAAGGLLEGRLRGNPRPVRRRAWCLAPLPPAAGRRRVLRRAHGGPPGAPGAPRREEDRVPCPPEGCPSRGERRARRDREPRRGRDGAPAAPRLAADRGLPLLLPHRRAGREEGVGEAGGHGLRRISQSTSPYSAAPRPRGASRSICAASRSTTWLVRAGLADGTLAIDTRLRDALRRLRRDDGTFAPPDPGGPGRVAAPHPTPQQDAEFAAEVAPLVEIDGVIRAEERIRALERRLEDAEQGARNVARRLTRR